MVRWVILMCLLVSIVEASFERSNVFNVKNYDAIANGKNDDSKAFLNAWSDACKFGESATVEVPIGIYMLNPIVFTGPCKSPITFLLKGTLIAPTNNPSTDTSWINFRYLNDLKVTGGGILDGQGASTWGRQNNAHPVLMVSFFFNKQKLL
ncbi:putative polygalacturonase [Lupinus albus]|uniref:Putative polygalacturonase n=1 Tax=Lupinus albus TaxID=3870 RepID=A0A6A4NYY9_LUPAL|nr:putative polygalacturonase [Lupinus albus]